jgi:hypothetical protein
MRGAPWWRASGGKEPPATGQRSGGGRQLGGRGAVVSSGRGRGDEGGLGGLSERPVRAAVFGGQGSGDGEHEGEAFGVELAEDIGEREVGGARGHKKLRRSRNPVAVRGGRNNSGAGGERGSDRSWWLL